MDAVRSAFGDVSPRYPRQDMPFGSLETLGRRVAIYVIYEACYFVDHIVQELPKALRTNSATAKAVSWLTALITLITFQG